MRNPWTSKLVLKLILAAIILVAIAYLYDSLSLNQIPSKSKSAYLRIGYINLHSSKVTEEDLKKLELYDCDIWLFLEWNGDNFFNYPEFSSHFIKNYEFVNKNTYGVLVLSKTAQVQVTSKIINKPQPCNYPLHVIQFKSGHRLKIYLAHAPPPVPTCEFGTAKYLNGLVSTISSAENAPDEVIIGDLNTLQFEASIEKIKDRGFLDAQETLSLMPQGTFSFFTWLPKFLKIDYVFHKGKIAPKLLGRFSLSNSDHSGWVVDLEFK